MIVYGKKYDSVKHWKKIKKLVKAVYTEAVFITDLEYAVKTLQKIINENREKY